MDRRDLLLGALAATLPAPALAQDAISSRARALYRRATVLDCNQIPPMSTALPLPQQDLDLARSSGVSAIKVGLGGFNAPFEEVVAEIAFYQRAIETHPDTFAQIRTVGDIAAAKRARKLGMIFSFEAVACLEDKLDRIDLFRNMGVRVMQLSYNQTSPFGAGVLSPPGDTLTELGREAIARMEAVGVALDLSHSNAATTDAALEAAVKPPLITHAGCYAVHSNPRNKTDAQMRAVAEKGGVFGIYAIFLLAPAGRQPTLDDYMAHMTHALDVCGEDHVGIGTDTSFGAMDLSEVERAAWLVETERRRAAGVAGPDEDGRLPYTEGLNRADRCLVIADALLDRGYPPRVVEKVLGGNFIRAFGAAWG